MKKITITLIIVTILAGITTIMWLNTASCIEEANYIIEEFRKLSQEIKNRKEVTKEIAEETLSISKNLIKSALDRRVGTPEHPKAKGSRKDYSCVLVLQEYSYYITQALDLVTLVEKGREVKWEQLNQLSSKILERLKIKARALTWHDIEDREHKTTSLYEKITILQDSKIWRELPPEYKRGITIAIKPRRERELTFAISVSPPPHSFGRYLDKEEIKWLYETIKTPREKVESTKVVTNPFNEFKKVFDVYCIWKNKV